NHDWFHMANDNIISMPDKWEYPWYAAWDLAFHSTVLGMVDLDFAKEQVEIMVSESYLHPNGQIPAYEWNFSDVNPPVTAWAALHVYEHEVAIRGEGDREWLTRVFDRLLTNFTWWVNRKDPDGRNLFEGGFLGLDNIGIFDRSADVVPALRHVLEPNADGRRMLTLVGPERLRRILTAMLDEDEFLGPHGIRAISRRHLDQPYEFDWDHHHYEVGYLPAESNS